MIAITNPTLLIVSWAVGSSRAAACSYLHSSSTIFIAITPAWPSRPTFDKVKI